MIIALKRAIWGLWASCLFWGWAWGSAGSLAQENSMTERFGAASAAEGGAELEGEAEGDEEFETDRDSITPSTALAAPGRTVFESSYTFIENRRGPATHSFPEALFRYGLSDRVELRLGWNYEVGGVNTILSGNATPAHAEEESGSRLLYGAKFSLLEQRHNLPQTALIVQGTTPTSGESSISNLSLTPVWGWTLANGWVWDSACRFQTSHDGEEDHFNVWTPSTVLKVPLHEQWQAHVEYFSVFSDGREEATAQHFFSPGIHRLITPNMEIGLRVGWGLNDQAPDFFSNFGLGWQF